MLIQEPKMCFFVETISQLENEEGKNLNTNISSKQAEQIAKDHNSSFNNKANETINQKLGNEKQKQCFLSFSF